MGPVCTVARVNYQVHPNLYAAAVATARPWYGGPCAGARLSWPIVPQGHYRALVGCNLAGMHQAGVDFPAGGKARAASQVSSDAEWRP